MTPFNPKSPPPVLRPDFSSAGSAEGAPLNEAEAAEFILALVTSEHHPPVDLRRIKTASPALEPAFETLVNLVSDVKKDD